jgi:hypothetical protein
MIIGPPPKFHGVRGILGSRLERMSVFPCDDHIEDG